MRASQLFSPTLREIPSDAETISHQLLLRAGYIRKASAGIYSYLPLASRVLKKIMQIVREEMDQAGGQEVMLPIIQPRELWEKSGRWDVYGDEMFRLTDRHQRYFALGPTHEEIITALVDGDVHSYRDLPLLLYQIQNKYRDEIRPRFGIMRGREFIMKDLYSFDIDDDGLEVSYRKMYQAYSRIYDRLGLNYRIVEADSGAIGGNESHEFIVLAATGESEIVYCSQCDYAANVEKAVCRETTPDQIAAAEVELGKPERQETPGQHTVEEVADFLDMASTQILKTLLYLADGELIAVLARGDREINEIKLKNVVGCNQLVMAGESTVREICGAGFGSLGPIGLKIKLYADLEVAHMHNFVCGANQDGFHIKNVNMGRDFTPYMVVDIRSAALGDACPQCGAALEATRGIEAGHIFKLGAKYSMALEAAFLDQTGKAWPMVMGCYGIGISRTMAAAVEQCYDQDGIKWPLAIAPYQVIIVPVNAKNQEQMQVAEQLYQELTALGQEVILDDRDERAGVKFKDADLIGIPLRINIGPKSLQEKQVEVKKRWNNEVEMVAVELVVQRIQELIES